MLSARFLPVEPLPPQPPHEVCSAAPSVRRFTIGAGTAVDACDPTPSVQSIVRVVNHDVDSRGRPCVARIENVVVASTDVVEFRLVSPPCAAHPPKAPRPAVAVNSEGIKILTGEEITVEVQATDACGNTGTANFDPTVEPSPLCDEVLIDLTCCPALRRPQDAHCKEALCGR